LELPQAMLATEELSTAAMATDLGKKTKFRRYGG
jgi:hypothetical protein